MKMEEKLEKSTFCQRQEMATQKIKENLEYAAISINEIQEALQDAPTHIFKIEKKDIVLVLGATGVGKSVLINYLKDCDFILTEHEETGRKFLAPKPGHEDRLYAKPGNGPESKTYYPQALSIEKEYKEEKDTPFYCDCPGHFDTNQDAKASASRLLVQQAIEKARSIKGIIICMPFSSMDTRLRDIRDLLVIMDGMFKNAETLNLPIIFVATKAEGKSTKQFVANINILREEKRRILEEKKRKRQEETDRVALERGQVPSLGNLSKEIEQLKKEIYLLSLITVDSSLVVDPTDDGVSREIFKRKLDTMLSSQKNSNGIDKSVFYISQSSGDQRELARLIHKIVKEAVQLSKNNQILQEYINKQEDSRSKNFEKIFFQHRVIAECSENYRNKDSFSTELNFLKEIPYRVWYESKKDSELLLKDSIRLIEHAIQTINNDNPQRKIGFHRSELENLQKIEIQIKDDISECRKQITINEEIFKNFSKIFQFAFEIGKLANFDDENFQTFEQICFGKNLFLDSSCQSQEFETRKIVEALEGSATYIKELREEFENGLKHVNKIRNKNIVLVLGKSGVGKSMLVTYVKGCDFTLQTNEETGCKFLAPKPGHEDRLYAKPGNNPESKTYYPQALSIEKEYKEEKDTSFYCDCPGYFDTNQNAKASASRLLVQQAIEKARSIKGIVICMPFNSMDTSRDLLVIMDGMFKSAETLNLPIIFVVTKAEGGNTKQFVTMIDRFLRSKKEMAGTKRKQQEEIERISLERGQTPSLGNLPKEIEQLEKEVHFLSLITVDNSLVIEPADGGISREVFKRKLDAMLSSQQSNRGIDKRVFHISQSREGQCELTKIISTFIDGAVSLAGNKRNLEAYIRELEQIYETKNTSVVKERLIQAKSLITKNETIFDTYKKLFKFCMQITKLVNYDANELAAYKTAYNEYYMKEFLKPLPQYQYNYYQSFEEYENYLITQHRYSGGPPISIRHYLEELLEYRLRVYSPKISAELTNSKGNRIAKYSLHRFFLNKVSIAECSEDFSPEISVHSQPSGYIEEFLKSCLTVADQLKHCRFEQLPNEHQEAETKKVIETFENAAVCLKDTRRELESASRLRNKGIILVLGKTDSGKSVLINYLRGNDFILETDEETGNCFLTSKYDREEKLFRMPSNSVPTIQTHYLSAESSYSEKRTHFTESESHLSRLKSERATFLDSLSRRTDYHHSGLDKRFEDLNQEINKTEALIDSGQEKQTTLCSLISPIRIEKEAMDEKEILYYFECSEHFNANKDSKTSVSRLLFEQIVENSSNIKGIIICMPFLTTDASRKEICELLTMLNNMFPDIETLNLPIIFVANKARGRSTEQFIKEIKKLRKSKENILVQKKIIQEDFDRLAFESRHTAYLEKLPIQIRQLEKEIHMLSLITVKNSLVVEPTDNGRSRDLFKQKLATILALPQNKVEIDRRVFYIPQNDTDESELVYLSHLIHLIYKIMEEAVKLSKENEMLQAKINQQKSIYSKNNSEIDMIRQRRMPQYVENCRDKDNNFLKSLASDAEYLTNSKDNIILAMLKDKTTKNTISKFFELETNCKLMHESVDSIGRVIKIINDSNPVKKIADCISELEDLKKSQIEISHNIVQCYQRIKVNDLIFKSFTKVFQCAFDVGNLINFGGEMFKIFKKICREKKLLFNMFYQQQEFEIKKIEETLKNSVHYVDEIQKKFNEIVCKNVILTREMHVINESMLIKNLTAFIGALLSLEDIKKGLEARIKEIEKKLEETHERIKHLSKPAGTSSEQYFNSELMGCSSFYKKKYLIFESEKSALEEELSASKTQIADNEAVFNKYKKIFKFVLKVAKHMNYDVSRLAAYQAAYNRYCAKKPLTQLNTEPANTSVLTSRQETISSFRVAENLGRMGVFAVNSAASDIPTQSHVNALDN